MVVFSTSEKREIIASIKHLSREYHEWSELEGRRDSAIRLLEVGDSHKAAQILTSTLSRTRALHKELRHVQRVEEHLLSKDHAAELKPLVHDLKKLFHKLKTYYKLSEKRLHDEEELAKTLSVASEIRLMHHTTSAINLVDEIAELAHSLRSRLEAKKLFVTLFAGTLGASAAAAWQLLTSGEQRFENADETIVLASLFLIGVFVTGMASSLKKIYRDEYGEVEKIRKISSSPRQ